MTYGSTAAMAVFLRGGRGSQRRGGRARQAQRGGVGRPFGVIEDRDSGMGICAMYGGAAGGGPPGGPRIATSRCSTRPPSGHVAVVLRGDRGVQLHAESRRTQGPGVAVVLRGGQGSQLSSRRRLALSDACVAVVFRVGRGSQRPAHEPERGPAVVGGRLPEEPRIATSRRVASPVSGAVWRLPSGVTEDRNPSAVSHRSRPVTSGGCSPGRLRSDRGSQRRGRRLLRALRRQCRSPSWTTEDHNDSTARTSRMPSG